MLAAPTIPEFHRRDLRPLLEGEFGCPAAGENDARACALAECRFGAGRGCRWMVYMTVSTGNGGGVILDGRLLRGATGTAGEVGHQAILPEGGGPCDCGGRGCLETLASGRAIAARGRAALQAVRPDRDHSDLTARDVHAAFLAGEEWAKRVWADTALYLGLGIANLINAYDPEAVVLGGGVIDGAGEDLLAPVRAVVWERCMPSLSRPVAICAAALGPDTGILAAATLAWNPLHIPEH
jgi:glucokinase